MICLRVTLIVFLNFFILGGTTQADELTSQQITRVATVKNLLGSIEKRSSDELAKHIGKTHSTELQLQIWEAVAVTYKDMIKQYGVETQERREWLYSMIQLNMAYFRLGGEQEESTTDTALNLTIRRKLKEHLPANFFSNRSVFFSLDK